MLRSLPALLLLGLGTTSVAGQTSTYKPQYPQKVERGAYVVDAGGRATRWLEVGSTLHVGARGLRPRTTYEFRLAVDREQVRSLEEAISFARVTTDARGEVQPFVLWYESGVIGCAKPPSETAEPRPHSYRTFDEAERALRGKTLTVSIHAVEHDRSGRTPPMKLRAEPEPEQSLRLPVSQRRSPMVFPSDPSGCLLNSRLTGDDDLYVSGRNFRPGESLEISVVPNQRLWFVGDAISDLTGASGAAAPERVRVDRAGRFTVRVWDRANQRRGAYDVVAHRVGLPGTRGRSVAGQDVISFAAETGFVFFLRYPVGGPTMDLAGRPVSRTPYFEFADSFAETNDPVWAAVDPTYVPVNHPGGTYGAYYVVNHRGVAGWDPMMGGSADLTNADVSGGIEVHPVKAGCVNGTDVIVWQPPLSTGNYDVVVDFGLNPAASAQQYATDDTYDPPKDFLDGADQVGFVVAEDPYVLGPTPVGQDSYSTDDFFPTLGGASNVDLRAVIRYPAVSSGVGTQVAPGKHPLFLMLHGNHWFCQPNVGSFSCNFTHANCPNKVKNHEGYMHLLDALASHGIIAVSIDGYDLTDYPCGLGVWVQERGQLILKHMELWSHLNDNATFQTYPNYFAGRFANHVDLTKISVSGHSRGGEASVSAFIQNANPAFTINSVSSVAPIDFHSYVLPDVPYFVILPAGDGDVSDLSGMRIYDRAGSGLNPADATLKSGVDVYGANHNFFNTVWAVDADDNPGRVDPIPTADQQKIGEALLAAFVRVHLNNELVYLDVLRGKLKFPSTAGYKVFPFHHEKNHSRIEAGAGSLAVPSGGASVASVSGPSVHVTQAVKVGWPSSSAVVTYTVPMTQRDASGFEVLSFRVAQTNSADNPVNGDQEFQVELVGGGKVKATYTGNFGRIPKPYDRGGSTQNVMTTVRIPLHSFIMNNAGVTLDNIDTIRLKFTGPGKGEIYVDDVEFSR